jgi:hypothetical protein
MSGTSEALELLNKQTFDAEAQTLIGGEHWREFLQRSLAANFSIRRANGATQIKAEMIEFIAGFGVLLCKGHHRAQRGRDETRLSGGD